jgi:antibiotic biosynthesis monooxygenase (ABM) superfamily enzyme
LDCREHLDRWLGSDERQAWLQRIADQRNRTMNVIGGFAGRFPAADSPPVAKWKQSIAVLIAPFPTAPELTVLRHALLPDLPWYRACCSRTCSVSPR